MSVREYVGARYVPLFAEPLAWDSTQNYEPLTIVLHQGNSYTSRQYVPAGIEITNENFWALTGNYNAQIEQYRRDVAALTSELADVERVYVKAYSTVADMKGDTDYLTLGLVCHTNGFHTAGDGGAAWYVISSTGTANEMDIIACGDLFANLVTAGNNITPEMYGAYGDSTHDDSEAMQRWIDVAIATNTPATMLGNATYKIDTPIEVTGKVSIAGCGCNIIADNGAFKCVADCGNMSIANMHITKTGQMVEGEDKVALLLSGAHIWVENIQIGYFNYGIRFTDEYTTYNQTGTIIRNVHIRYSEYALYISGGASKMTDFTISDCTLASTKQALYTTAGIGYLVSNIHTWGGCSEGTFRFNNGNNNTITNCYFEPTSASSVITFTNIRTGNIVNNATIVDKYGVPIVLMGGGMSNSTLLLSNISLMDKDKEEDSPNTILVESDGIPRNVFVSNITSIVNPIIWASNTHTRINHDVVFETGGNISILDKGIKSGIMQGFTAGGQEGVTFRVPILNTRSRMITVRQSRRDNINNILYSEKTFNCYITSNNMHTSDLPEVISGFEQSISYDSTTHEVIITYAPASGTSSGDQLMIEVDPGLVIAREF